MPADLTQLASWPMLLLLTAVGAFLGGLTRYTLAVTLPPYKGTLAANILGSLVLGMAISQALEESVWFVSMLGFSGALSTWSTLAGEVVQLARQPAQVTASLRCQVTPVLMSVGYLALTILTGVVAAFIGLHL